jgi:GT2 family glycosyltransferase
MELERGRNMAAEERATIIVLTYNRCTQLLSKLESLFKLPGQWPMIVIDNGSTDGTAAAVAARFPSVMLIRARRNLGAAACNIGVAYTHTPYVAFCDDDTQWEPGALQRAICLLDAAPTVAVVSACVQIGVMRRLDPACLSMAQSPLARGDLPGPQLLDFMAGAGIVRTRAFYVVGGYWPPFFWGGEKAMAFDLLERGWRIIYAADVVTRHFSVALCDSGLRERLKIRNAIWIAWMRRPAHAAWRKTLLTLQEACERRIFWSTLWSVLPGLPRVLRQRQVISSAVEKMQALLDLPVYHPPCGTDHRAA